MADGFLESFYMKYVSFPSIDSGEVLVSGHYLLGNKDVLIYKQEAGKEYLVSFSENMGNDFKNFIYNPNSDKIVCGTFGDVYLAINKFDKKEFALMHICKKRVLENYCSLSIIYQRNRNLIKFSSSKYYKTIFLLRR